MKILRTPDKRFDNIPDYPFQANYFELKSGIRMHYVEEGEASQQTVLLLHGEPSWSFLYRKMIPVLSDAGYHVVVPDLIGFGKSDKPSEQSDYTYAKHLEWLGELMEHLQIKAAILFCQDWGGLLGLRMAAEQDDLFSMIVTSNTALPTGSVEMPKAFTDWREFSRSSPAFDIGRIMQKASPVEVPAEVIAAYNAPFPDDTYKAGARIFPSLVPIDESDPEAANNQKAWKALMQWKKPFLTAFGTDDPITKGVDKFFQQLIPGTKGQAHQLLKAGHFIQEEKGEELAQIIIDFHQSNQSD